MKKLLIATVVGVLTAGVATHAFMPVGSIIVPDGDEVVCRLTCEGHVVVVGYDPDGDGVDDPFWTNGSGSASFTCIGSSQSPVASGTFVASSMTLTGTDANFGNFSFSFDGSRPAPNTTITANQPGNDFPASASVYANVIGTIAGLPGTYINRNTCHMTATINSFDPQVNEHYSFTNDVDFVDVNGGPNAPTAFTIPANSVVTMN